MATAHCAMTTFQRAILEIKLKTDEDDQDGYFLFNHPESGDLPAA